MDGDLDIQRNDKMADDGGMDYEDDIAQLEADNARLEGALAVLHQQVCNLPFPYCGG